MQQQGTDCVKERDGLSKSIMPNPQKTKKIYSTTFWTQIWPSLESRHTNPNTRALQKSYPPSALPVDTKACLAPAQDQLVSVLPWAHISLQIRYLWTHTEPNLVSNKTSNKIKSLLLYAGNALGNLDQTPDMKLRTQLQALFLEITICDINLT